MNRVCLALSTVLALVLAAGEGVAQAPPSAPATGREVVVEGGKYVDVTVPELQLLTENADFLIVNVHVPFEGDLPDTDASIPFDQIEAHIAHVSADKDAKILLYCRSGRMSTTAAATLAKMGYTAVHNLVGGFNAWAAAGLPMAER